MIRVYGSVKIYIIEFDLDILFSKTNLLKPVIDSSHARYKCDKVLVTKIYCKYNHKNEEHVLHGDDDIVYEKGKHVFTPNYDDNTFNANGIYFFLTKEAAQYHNFKPNYYVESTRLSSLKYMIPFNFNGQWKKWYDNGQLQEMCSMVNGNKHGLYESYYDNGRIKERYHCRNGLRQGLHELWYNNGKVLENCQYRNGIKHGLRVSWYDNGQMHIRTNYVNSQSKGLIEIWSKDGTELVKSIQ